MKSQLIFDQLDTAAKNAGTNLTEVCRLANVDRSVVERWKGKNPKSLDIFNRLIAAIEQQKLNNAETTTVSE